MRRFYDRPPVIPRPSSLRARLVCHASPQENLALDAARSLGMHWEQSYPICTKTGKHYYGDLYCDTMRLCVEIDGRAHDRSFRVVQDLARDKCLRDLDIRTFRIRCPFTYDQVKGEISRACIQRYRQIMFLWQDVEWNYPLPEVPAWVSVAGSSEIKPIY